jgi:hypothetical protein
LFLVRNLISNEPVLSGCFDAVKTSANLYAVVFGGLAFHDSIATEAEP